jgi:hypothetical protein
MASQTTTQNPTKKEPFFVYIKVGEVYTKYRAWVGDYVVRGLTMGNKEAVKSVVGRMAEARADLIDKVKDLVSMVADHVVKASEARIVDIGLAMGTYFHLGEYIMIQVKVQRLNGHLNERWWGQIRVMFKGADGLKALSKHVVERYVEFYSDKISRDKIYNVLYEAARMAFNAYIWAHKASHSSQA